jgi:hypothetical protein
VKQCSAFAAAAVVTVVACTAAALPVLMPLSAVAQANPTMTNVIPEGGASAVQGKVQSVDPNTRTITIAPSSGTALPLVAPANVGIDNLEPGDVVSAHYTRAVAFLLVPPGAEERPGSMTATVDQAARRPGQIGPQATEIRGAVTKINGPRSFDIVDAGGGGVYTVQVTDPARVALVQQLKVDDRLTVSVGPLVLTSLAKCGPFGLVCG